ncbi:hypothetical protein RJ639_043715 [Escallonia herrerae]|uniref:Alpha/beta hydrolase fold-3 domain-containing protein n=1 Tax=Escallonia herrerae TaxID=1293975 RepID=A0AA89B3N6_9ASTE|nr:hypothetical protein RJ639_043715 [Escallonia herrerae]
MDSAKADVAHDFYPWFRVYTDGSVERFLESPLVPPSLDVRSKDIAISTTACARLFLPKAAPNEKLPLLIYIHGGFFSIESPFSSTYHGYVNSLVSQSKVIAVSIEYRLAPENPVPACYDDCYAVMKWVAQHKDSAHRPGLVPWLSEHADFGKAEPGCASVFAVEAAVCEKVLIFTTGLDQYRQRGCTYYAALKKSGWEDPVEIENTPGEDHVFHLSDPTSDKAKAMMKKVASFINPANAASL